jgi:hypothetical protein
MQIKPVYHNAILLYSLIHLPSTALQLAQILIIQIILLELVCRFVLQHPLSLDKMLHTHVLLSVSILPISSTCLLEYASILVQQTILCRIRREIV